MVVKGAKLLVIGGTGCLSSAVVEEALACGCRVTAITRGHGRLPPEVESVVADCYDYHKVSQLLAGRRFDAVIDFLCFSASQLEQSFKLYSAHVRQYVFISSCAVYDTRGGDWCTEDSPKVSPDWDYSVKKWECERLLAKLAAETDVVYTVVRPCVTYGDTRIPYGIAPRYGYHWTFVARALAGKPIIRWNHGCNRCNMTRVEDFAVGVVGLLGNPKAYGEAFNVCGDEAPTFQQVIDAIGVAIGKPMPVIDIDTEFYANALGWRKGELMVGRALDALNVNDKLKRVVAGFRQTIPLAAGVAKTIAAYEAQDYQKGIDWAFDADTDRIIRRWCAAKKLDARQYNLRFVDYLGSATAADRWAYYKRMHAGSRWVALVDRVLGGWLRG